MRSVYIERQPEIYELIETLWNVNEQQRQSHPRCSHGINRNIVECKYIGANCVKGNSCELIETLWNVNSARLLKRHGRQERINRNIVECKFKSG